MKNSPRHKLIVSPRLSAALIAFVLIACHAQAQIISNGTDIGTNVTAGMALSPVSGTGTLLVNSNSRISAPGPFGATVGTPRGSTCFITNNGLMTNTGTSDSSQVLDMGLGGVNFSVINNGTMSINSSSVYEVFRVAAGAGGDANSGTFSNTGLIQALGAGAGMAFNHGQYVVNNTGTIRAGIGFWGGSTPLPGGTSLTVNQLAGESGSNLTNDFSVFSFAKTTTVNVSGGTLTRPILIGGNGNSSFINLSGGAINGNALNGALDFRDSTTNTVNITGGSLNGDVRFGTSAGVVNFNRGDAYAYTNVISGSGRVVNSSGTTTLTKTNTYTGTTTVAGGGLVINGSIANSATTVQNGGTLSGSGTVGALTIQSGGTVSPGNSPGTLNINGNINWLGGGNYNWQVLDTAGVAGSQWDLLSASGVLDLSALTVGSEFNINLWSLSSTGPDVNGAIANFNNTQSYTWRILTASNGITGYTGTDQFIVNVDAVNGTAGFANALAPGWGFSVVQDGNNLNLVYGQATGVPEPGTWAAAALLAGGAAFTRWRRRARPHRREIAAIAD